MPSVSIVVTAKNEEKNIASLLDSIGRLDEFEGVEVIVVDGGSKDKTQAVVSKYPFVKLIVSESSISQGRNLGIKNSNGRIIAFTDADCIVEKNWLRRIAKHFEKDPRIGVVGGPYIPIEQPHLWSKYLGSYISTYFPSESGFTSPKSIGTGNAAYLRECVEKVGGFNEQLAIGEDIELNQRITRAGYKLFFAEDVKVHHKYRATFREVTRWAFSHSKASPNFNKITGNYVKLIFPYGRTIALCLAAMLTVGIILQAFLLVGVVLLSIPAFYIYRLLRFEKSQYAPRFGLRARLSFPLIDLYVHLVGVVGSIVGAIGVCGHTFRERLNSHNSCASPLD